MGKRILIIGRSDIIFIRRLLQKIKAQGLTDLEIELFDNRHRDEAVCRDMIPYPVHGLQEPVWGAKLLSVPVLRIFLRMLFEYITLRKLLQRGRYDAINIQELPFYSWLYVVCAHRHGAQAILTPIGSDALRPKGWTNMLLKKGFDAADHVTITMGSGFAEKVLSIYNIDRNKVSDLSYGSDAISEILRMKGHYTRTELAKMLNLPQAEYYICCGYNAYRAQNHLVMLQAIAANAERLPKGCKILFPLGYGGGSSMRRELEQANARYGLDLVFLMDYLPAEKVAALRLITDLFIHIQDTDAHCFTMREFLLADTQAINGQWVSYPELEQYGMPYHVCETKDTLSQTLTSILSGKQPPVKCPEKLKVWLQQSSWENVAKKWTDFYLSLNDYNNYNK